MLENIKRLSQIKSIADVESLSKARYPGSHCPLFGATIILKNFKDSAVIILGTQECAYYTKSMVVNNDDFYDRCYSVITSQHDITFGTGGKVEEAISELLEESSPKSVFIVTTCVIEVIGDDLDSIALDLTEKYDLPIMVVHTEHFRCDSHLGGMENVLSAIVGIMKEVPKERCVNIVGHRHSHFNDSEIFNILKEHNIGVNLNIPAICSTDDIRNASRATLNIVCDDIGIAFAEEMKDRFGTEYVKLNKSCDLDIIYKVYEDIFKAFNIELPKKIKELRDETEKQLNQLKNSLNGVTYIYGNTPVNPFEMTRFLTDMGMVAQLVQTKDIKGDDFLNIEKIKEAGLDPYVTKSANIAPLQEVYDILKPVFYIGHESASKLSKKGIIQIALDSAGEKIGFEMPLFIAASLTRYYTMKKGA